MRPNFFIEDNGNIYIVFNFNFRGNISGFNLM